MTRKEQELRQQLQEKRDSAQGLIDEGKTEEARSMMDEAKGIKEQIELLSEARDLEAPEVEERDFAPTAEPEERSVENQEQEYRDAFYKAIRGKRMSSDEIEILESRAMKEGSDEKGGYTVPQDIETKINELKRQTESLEDFVRVEDVGTNKGSRVLEKSGEMTPFSDMEELEEMDEMTEPKFTQIKYEISNRGGFLPISNDLLNDTAENLKDYLSNWVAKKSIVTRNKLILDIIDDKSGDKQDLTDFDDFKKALNVDLDPAIAADSIFLTNQDGFHFMDKMKDENDNYLMQRKPTDETKHQFAGKDVVVLSNKYLETDDDKAPVIIGDLEEAIVLFDRKKYSIDITDVGGKAWRTNSSELRAIEREDIKAWDEDAFIYGQVDVSGDSGES